MLPREKRRAGWSIAVGVVVAGLVAGYHYFQAFEANQTLNNLVSKCEGLPPGYDIAKVYPPLNKTAPGASNTAQAAPDETAKLPPGWTEEDNPERPSNFTPDACNPKALVDRIDLVGEQAKIADMARQAENDRADGRSSSLIAFAIFSLPLAWYLVLDRIRELSAAITGRDRGL
jgi:hypothetical protein